MKKFINILIAILLVVSLAACDLPLNNGSSPFDDGTSNSSVPTEGILEPTDPTAPSGGTTVKPDAPKAEVLHRDICYEFVWTETDSRSGILTISEILTATAADMESIGLSGSLIYKPEILTYAVTYTKDVNGVYTAEGTITSAASSVEGESAAAFIEMMKQGLGDSALEDLTGRVLDGEVLTGKEDIENFIWELDNTVQVTFTVQDGEMTVSQYEKNYISWGFQAPTKEVYYIDNAVVRALDEYEHDELVRMSEYRENGMIAKESYYFEGELTSTVYYDENGNEIDRIEFEEDDDPNTDPSGPDDAEDNVEEVYDANGNLIKQTFFDADGYKIEEYEYDSNGNLIKMISYGEKNCKYYEQGFNAEGKLTYDIFYYSNGNKRAECHYFADDTRKMIDYYENGNKKLEMDVAPDGSVTSYVEYDENGDPIGVPPDITPDEPVYDEDGNEICTEYYDNGNKRDEIAYNADGIRVWAIWYYENGNKAEQTQYDSQGRSVHDVSFDENGEKTIEILREYGTDGRVKKTTVIDASTNVVTVREELDSGSVTREYEDGVLKNEKFQDPDGYRTKEIIYVNGKKSKELDYNRNNKVICDTRYHANEQVSTVTRYNDAGFTVRQEQYNEMGVMILYVENDDFGRNTILRSYNDDGSFRRHFTFTYHENGKLKEETGLNENGSTIYALDYNEKGILLRRWLPGWVEIYDGETGWLLETLEDYIIRDVYEYREDGTLKERRKYNKAYSDNIAGGLLMLETYDEDGILWISSRYDSMGYLSAKFTYDKDGNIIDKVEYT